MTRMRFGSLRAKSLGRPGAADSSLSASEIFTPIGVPGLTYVERRSGADAEMLSQALDNRGSICLLTGPSKTGKTTLFSHVLSSRNSTPAVVRGNNGISAVDLWQRALEVVNHETATSREASTATEVGGAGKIVGKIFGTGGEASVSRKSSRAEKETRSIARGLPGPAQIAPHLLDQKYVLVLEDFHYLSATTRQAVFQDWKIFSDSKISVLVVGTTHRAADLAEANPDLAGRITHIKLGSWDRDDLEEIARRGFRHLHVTIPRRLITLIAIESFGLPIIVQSVCLRLMVHHKITTPAKERTALELTDRDLFRALTQVAVTNYAASFARVLEDLSNLTASGDQMARVYALLLGLFVLSPPHFTLSKSNIEERLQELPFASQVIEGPPQCFAMLERLEEVQGNLEMKLLDWDAKRKHLYMLQPTLLFYLRWKEYSTRLPSRLESLDKLLAVSPQDSGA